MAQELGREYIVVASEVFEVTVSDTVTVGTTVLLTDVVVNAVIVEDEPTDKEVAGDEEGLDVSVKTTTIPTPDAAIITTATTAACPIAVRWEPIVTSELKSAILPLILLSERSDYDAVTRRRAKQKGG
jgi:hypothetical protein